MNFSLEQLSDPVVQYFESHAISLGDLQIEIAGAAGSDRMYYRLKCAQGTWVLMQSPLDLDFERFVQITNWLASKDFPVPEIYAVSVQGQILLQDLGSDQLLDVLKAGQEALPLYEQVVQGLVQFQSLAQNDLLSSIRAREFGMEDLLWESDYFAAHFLGQYLGLGQDLGSLWQDWRMALAQKVNSQNKTLMHRDFQSQNLMLREGRLWWIDYQGARYGSEFYDLASVLWDPYVELSEKQVHSCFEQFCALKGMDPKQYWLDFLCASLQRLMQACGAYANLYLNKGKKSFEQHLEPGRRRLIQVLELAMQAGLAQFPLLQDLAVIDD